MAYKKIFYVEISGAFEVSAETPEEAVKLVQRRQWRGHPKEAQVFENEECTGTPIYTENL